MVIQPALESRTVLVAESEPVQALDLDDNLRRCGCAVLGPVSSGAEALCLLRRARPDMALLDAWLPDGGVLAVAQTLAAQEVPFALMATGCEAGPLAHPLLRQAPRLMKPYRPPELYRSVRVLYRAELEVQLAQAERYIREGRERLARQLRLVERLAAGSPDAALAEKLTCGIARSLRLMRVRRAQLLGQLAAEMARLSLR
jgi:CheY-like chemotaxis protein